MPRRVVVAGASGLIGSALVESLRADGVDVTRLVRRPAQAPDEVEWLTSDAPLDPAVLEGADAVVGLNGASIGRFPWTASYKHTLVWSRIAPTQALARAVRELGDGCARVRLRVGRRVLRLGAARRAHGDVAARGESFLADLCGEWESAALGRRSARARQPAAHGAGRARGRRAQAPPPADEARPERADRPRNPDLAVDLARG